LVRTVANTLRSGQGKALNFNSRNGPVDLGIRRDVVVGVAREVEAGLVKHGGRKRAHPREKTAGTEVFGVVVGHGPGFGRGVGGKSMEESQKRVRGEEILARV